MYEIREYCDMINQDKPDIFELCQKAGIIPKTVSKLESLDEEDFEKYKQEVKFYYDSYKEFWKDVMQKYFKYKRPNLVNIHMSELESQTDPLYVYPCFMRCGKQHYVVNEQADRA